MHLPDKKTFPELRINMEDDTSSQMEDPMVFSSYLHYLKSLSAPRALGDALGWALPPAHFGRGPSIYIFQFKGECST